MAAAATAAAVTNGAIADAVPDYTVQLLGPAAHVEDINSSGMVVGWVIDRSGTTRCEQPQAPQYMRAFVAGAPSTYELLPLPAGYDGARAYSINDNGLIVGSAIQNHPTAYPQAVLWVPNRPSSLGYDVQLLAKRAGLAGSVAYAVNNDNQIVGEAFDKTTGASLPVWFNGPESVTDLTPYGAVSIPQDLNEHNVFVERNGDCFHLDSLTVVATPPGLDLPGTFEACSINNAGELVGKVTTPTGATMAICLTQSGTWEFFGVASTSAPAQAYDVNDKGVIVLDTMYPGAYEFMPAVHYPGVGLYPIDVLVPESPQLSWWFTPESGAAVNNKGQIAVVLKNPLTLESEVGLLVPIIRAGDVDRSGVVDVHDLEIVLKQWGPCGPDCAADVELPHGVVDVFDLLTVLQNWS